MNPSTLNNWMPLITLIVSSGVLIPLAVAGFRLLTQGADHIQNATARAWAQTAVHFVEQTLTTAPPYAKKDAAVRLLTAHGVPTGSAATLVESAVSQMNQAAEQALAQAAAAQPVIAVTPSAASIPDLTGVSTAVAGELGRLAAQLTAPPATAAVDNSPSTPVPAPMAPTTPQTPPVDPAPVSEPPAAPPTTSGDA